MKMIELTEVGCFGRDWFWNTRELECSIPFHPFLSFTLFEQPRKIYVNADMIEEMKEGIPTTHVKTETYVKRNKFVEFFFGKKHDVNSKTVLLEDKITWLKLSSGSTFCVNESMKQIEDKIKNDG